MSVLVLVVVVADIVVVVAEIEEDGPRSFAEADRPFPIY